MQTRRKRERERVQKNRNRALTGNCNWVTFFRRCNSVATRITVHGVAQMTNRKFIVLQFLWAKLQRLANLQWKATKSCFGDFKALRRVGSARQIPFRESHNEVEWRSQSVHSNRCEVCSYISKSYSIWWQHAKHLHWIPVWIPCSLINEHSRLFE